MNLQEALAALNVPVPERPLCIEHEHEPQGDDVRIMAFYLRHEASRQYAIALESTLLLAVEAARADAFDRCIEIMSINAISPSGSLTAAYNEIRSLAAQPGVGK